jgi:sugar (pentulose or hexulose) kinase
MTQTSAPSTKVVIGLDLGTTGVRSIAVTPSGNLLSSAHDPLIPIRQELPEGWHEQDPHKWWQAVATCLQALVQQIPSGVEITGICVVSTSGTILPVDSQGMPLYRAIMYNDNRGADLVSEIRQSCESLEKQMGYAISSSFALPKIIWLLRNQPGLLARTPRFLHAADFIVGRMTGEYIHSDTSNALKTGYNLIQETWPKVLERSLGLPLDRLPMVVAPGTPIGSVCRAASEATGIPMSSVVVAGATDGTASQIASGAVEPGAWNSTLGTTLVLKGISEQLFVDPQHRIYSHRHPQGWWMPGGASNTGAEWIQKDFPQTDPAKLDRQAAKRIPTSLVRYPLARIGERFPFQHEGARGFVIGNPADEIENFGAGLEGLALLERLAYSMMEEIGTRVGDVIHVTGAGSRSKIWLRIRASALGRQLERPALSSTAMGAALLAASSLWFSNITEAAEAMVETLEMIDPDRRLQHALDEKYEIFCSELYNRGYMQKKPHPNKDKNGYTTSKGETDTRTTPS